MSVAPASLDRLIDDWRDRLQKAKPVSKLGRVLKVTGLVIESEGPNVALGDVCLIQSPRMAEPLPAEVVGFRDETVLLMPLGPMKNMHAGCDVVVSERSDAIEVGPGLIGRIIDGLGRPMDGGLPLPAGRMRSIHAEPPNPLRRQRITKPLATGVRAVDLFTPLGRGQRLGVFAGSGVGKSTLMGMLARGSEADVNVIALVGERGRELREFIEKDLGPEGMARSVVVVSTSDQPAPLRMRAALLATAVAEHFRDEGRDVLFMMDSVTRFAMAQREIGLAVGEPPASRGYTPSVFAMLPRLMERTGMGERGSITALYTVLVDGDDFNEPISDAVRGILDGHLVLSRALATANHYPAVDVLESVSRLSLEICSKVELMNSGKARDLLAVYRKNEDVITIGAYNKGSNPKVDLAIDKHPKIMELLRQPVQELSPRDASFARLASIVA
jgi:flagellum-specific ATP synthase